MNANSRFYPNDQNVLHRLTQAWGTRAEVSLYLDRCQVDTPDSLVSKVWEMVRRRRSTPVGKVVDFGAGDGRFALGGHYLEYLGYEIDLGRCGERVLPERARLLHQCAFSETVDDADVCIGNPPYVRNQDLPSGWRQKVADSLFARTGVRLSGLANAWQYFFFLCLASTKNDGIVAVVIPYEWVSRPSARELRNFVTRHGWDVCVYRLREQTFDCVLTTSSITIVDKRASAGRWQYFEERHQGGFRRLPSVTESVRGAVDYLKRSKSEKPRVFAKRGLSPGTQRVLVLTEGERVRCGLRMIDDVVPCVTTLRHLEPDCTTISERVFDEAFRFAGVKCWLIRTDRPPGARLREYLSHVPSEQYQTSTCVSREEWWKFTMPEVPPILAATGFRGERPKIAINSINGRAVGSVSGIYGVPALKRSQFVAAFRQLELSDRIVPHSNGLKKVEINQLNSLLEELAKKTGLS